MLPKFYEDMFDVMDQRKTMNCDIYEKDGMYHVEMDIPGFKKDEIKIECHKGTITISAKHHYNKDEHEGKKFIRRERHFNEMSRSFYLGDIDDENIHATMDNGTLMVTIPTKSEVGKRTITIE